MEEYGIGGGGSYVDVGKGKWVEKCWNEMLRYEWDLWEFEGRGVNCELVCFLKEGD